MSLDESVVSWLEERSKQPDFSGIGVKTLRKEAEEALSITVEKADKAAFQKKVIALLEAMVPEKPVKRMRAAALKAKEASKARAQEEMDESRASKRKRTVRKKSVPKLNLPVREGKTKSSMNRRAMARALQVHRGLGRARSRVRADMETIFGDDEFDSDAELSGDAQVIAEGHRSRRRRDRNESDEELSGEAGDVAGRLFGEGKSKKEYRDGQRKSGKKKSRREHTEEDAGTQIQSEVDQLLDGMKRKVAKSNRSHNEKLDTVKQFLEKMSRVAEADRDALEAKQLAVQKIRHIDEFAAGLGKVDVQPLLVGAGALMVISNWLKLLPDGSLPSPKIREMLLKVLLTLPVEKEDLVESKIGHIVMLLLQHKSETRSNRVLCQKLVEKWSRPIFNRRIDYGDHEGNETYQVESQAHVPTSLQSGGNARTSRYTDVGQIEAEEPEMHPLTGRVRRPTVFRPTPAKMDFSMRPASRQVESRPSAPSDRHKELLSKLSGLKKKKSTNNGIAKVSISKLNL